MHFVEKNVNFNKNEMESKIENPRQAFREKNLVLQLMPESQIKSNELELAKEKSGRFLYRLFCPKGIFFFNV